MRHGRCSTPGKAFQVLLVFAAGLVAGCGTSGGPGAGGARTVASDSSQPIDRVKADQEKRRAAAAEETAQIPQGDTALQEWLDRAKANGLVKAGEPSGRAMPRPSQGRAVSEAPQVFPGTPRASEPDAGASTPGTESQAPSTHAVPTPAPAVPVVAASLPAESAPVPSPGDPLSELIRLSSRPDADKGQVAALEKALTAQELELYRAWRDLQSGAAGPDAKGLRKAAGEFARKVAAWADFKVSRALLCTRVEGFGLYTELPHPGPTYKMLAGRVNTVIVYVEVDGFATRQAGGDKGDGFKVELSQELTLYAGDGSANARGRDLVAWRKDPQAITDFSRNPRRDFFVVQRVDLPATLSVGPYVLKVRMTDRGNAAGAEAEATIPIDIVADPSAMK